MPADQKLIDPKLVKEAEKDESKKKSEEIVIFYLYILSIMYML